MNMTEENKNKRTSKMKIISVIKVAYQWTSIN